VVSWEPQWTHDLKGSVENIAIGEVVPEHMWVTSKSAGSWVLTKLSSNGERLKSIGLDSEPLSLWPARNSEQAQAFSLLAGFKDDTIRAYATEGNIIWQTKSEIDPSFKIGDRYDAPWFTDPTPPYSMNGVYSLLVEDLWGTGHQEIALGRPCTVELRKLDGALLGRVPTRWGNNTSLAVLKEKGKLLLVGKYHTGNPSLSGIRPDLTNTSDNFFSNLSEGQMSMHAWLQRGLSHLEVQDINGDGVDDVIYTLSGHWNELRAYEGKTDRLLWSQDFGPDKVGGGYMRGLEVLSAKGTNSKTIIVGTKAGWILAFDAAGVRLWQYHYGSSLSCMDSFEREALLAVGFENGHILLFDSEGKVRKLGKLGSAIRAIQCGSGSELFVGCSTGLFAKYVHGLTHEIHYPESLRILNPRTQN
jgi:hypothetical protein